MHRVCLKIVVLCAVLTLLGCSSNNISSLSNDTKYSKLRTINNFNDYVQFLKQQAAEQGVSTSTLIAQDNIHYIQKAVDLDRKQVGKWHSAASSVPNPNGTTNYLNRVLTQNKVDVAVNRYWEVLPQLTQASQHYGVQKEYLLALWGMESSFGYYQGNYDVLSVLATLAFEGRRESLFGKEFVNAMKMLDCDHVQRQNMLGSWAGAMGQTQFMPSAYLSYAADGDDDGVKDIWKNHYDVFASIASYLHTVGWNDQVSWGVEVHLSHSIPLSELGIEKQKAHSLKQWRAMGVHLANATNDELQKWNVMSSADLWLVRPDKDVGRAFLVTNNFRTLMDWNKSKYFAVSIGMFADRIKQAMGQ